MKKMMIGLVLILIVAMGGFCLAQSVDTGRPPHPSRGPMKPPPEAVAVCKGKTEGTTVQFTTSRGDTLKGVCKLYEGVLTALPPDRGARPPQGGRPPVDGGQTTETK